jgi:hypothetical protein
MNGTHLLGAETSSIQYQQIINPNRFESLLL